MRVECSKSRLTYQRIRQTDANRSFCAVAHKIEEWITKTNRTITSGMVSYGGGNEIILDIISTVKKFSPTSRKNSKKYLVKQEMKRTSIRTLARKENLKDIFNRFVFTKKKILKSFLNVNNGHVQDRSPTHDEHFTNGCHIKH